MIHSGIQITCDVCGESRDIASDDHEVSLLVMHYPSPDLGGMEISLAHRLDRVRLAGWEFRSAVGEVRCPGCAFEAIVECLA